MNIDTTYAGLIQMILDTGEEVQTRNSLCKRIFAEKFVFDKTPLVSVRKTAWKNSLREWEWFMSGSENINDLHQSVQSWWKPWATDLGNVHFNYSQQFRNYGYDDEWIDQISVLIEGVKDHPFSRRNVITTWHTAQMHRNDCLITNCHGTVIQAFVDTKNKLHLVTYQRSVDVIVGLPHNWFQYWAFLMWLAHRGGREVGTLTWIGGDCHIYDAHRDLAKRIADKGEQDGETDFAYGYTRFKTPQLVYNPTSEEFLAEDFSLDGVYNPCIMDKAEMIV